MSVKLGTLDISAFKVGRGDCTVYLGTTKLYEGDYKFQASYSDGTTFKCLCDGNTTLTTATTKPSGYEYSAMTDAVIGDCVTNVGKNDDTYSDSVFSECSSLSSVTIPNGVTYIGSYAFRGCSSLTSLTIPNGVTSIGDYAFYNCTSLSSVTIPSGVTSIGETAFGFCTSLQNITFLSGITSVAPWMFQHCTSLTSVTIPDSVTSIGYSAFYECTSLSSITLPSGVTNIGNNAFSRCSGLTSITVLATTPPTLGYGGLGNGSIYVPSESVETYKAASGWSDYASRIQAIPSD